MRFGLLVATLLLAGCSAPVEETGEWRALLTLPGGELPFGLSIERGNDGALSATIRNGEERVSVPRVAWEGELLRLEFPAFNNRMELARAGDGFEGTLTLTKRGGVRQVMPLRLTRGGDYRFFPAADVNADFAGRWRVTFIEDDGTETPAVGDFRQQNGRVEGTFRLATGDYRFLAGQVRDRRLFLSTFDGAHAFLFTAEQDENGRVSGDFWSGTKWHERWQAQRDADASLPDPNGLSQLRHPGERVTFSFPNIAGETVTHDDARFRDRILIIALAGTWCPNCHDEAAFLAPFFAERESRGLEVVGLMFEHLPEFEAAAEQVRRFRDKFDIGYELLVAGYSDKADATQTLGILERVIAYPTMIVLDRTGTVRRIHTGFNGPGTGVHYDEFREEFTAFIDGLLAEGES